MTLIKDTLKQRILADEYSYDGLKRIACKLYDELQEIVEEAENKNINPYFLEGDELEKTELKRKAGD